MSGGEGRDKSDAKRRKAEGRAVREQELARALKANLARRKARAASRGEGPARPIKNAAPMKGGGGEE